MGTLNNIVVVQYVIQIKSHFEEVKAFSKLFFLVQASYQSQSVQQENREIYFIYNYPCLCHIFWTTQTHRGIKI